jgi:hypothetical protein
VGQEDCYDDAHGESLLIETQHDLRERFGRVSRRDHDSSGRDGIVHGGVRVCQPGSHWILSASSTAAAVAFESIKGMLTCCFDAGCDDDCMCFYTHVGS